MLLRGSSLRWPILLLIACIVKVAVMVLTPPSGDLLNWTAGTSLVLRYLANGHFPPISVTGVYGPIELLLVPFFWTWTKLPIQHAPIYDMTNGTSTSAVLLALLMKLPPFIADIITGVVVFMLTLKFTHSKRKSKLACIIWYLNPYNIYWINAVGAMDVIPVLVLLLAIVVGNASRWFRSGFCVSIASILRIYPIFSLPFFLLGAQTRKARAYAASGFLLPLIAMLTFLYASGAATLNILVEVPKVEYWLMDFLGGNLTNVNQKLALVLVPFQLYVTFRYWRKPSSLLYLTTVSVLALLIGAQNTPAHHFLWVSPLLTMCVVLNKDEAWIFLLTFLTASLHLGPIFGIFPMALFSLIDPFFGGCFYAAKSVYLIKLNLESIIPVK